MRRNRRKGTRMRALKRLVVWTLETLSVAVLVGVFLYVVLGSPFRQSDFGRDLSFAIAGTAVVFMVGSGYLLSTALFGLVWRSQRLWLYPAIAAALFVAHVQFFATGWGVSTKVPVQAGGACIVFACTYAGGYFLRKWEGGRQATTF